MESIRTINSHHGRTLELRSFHNWFKRPSPPIAVTKHNDLLERIEPTVYKSNFLPVRDSNIIYCTKESFIKKPCSNLYNHIMQRNIFEHWKTYVIHKLSTRKSMFEAEYFYRTKLQRKILNALSKNVLLKWKSIVESKDNYITSEIVISRNYFKAQSYHNKLLLRQCFDCWVKYIAVTREKKLLKWRVAAICRSNCLKKYMIKWKAYASKRKQKYMARKFYERTIVRKCLTHWIDHFECAPKTILVTKAVKHYQQNLLRKCFTAWIAYNNMIIQRCQLKECVRQCSRKNILRRFFERIIRYANEVNNEKAAFEKAEALYNCKLTRKMFSAWLQWYYENIQNQLKVDRIREAHQNRRLRVSFTNWKCYVFRQKCKSRKILQMQSLYKKKLMIKSLRMLKHYAVYRGEKRIKLSYLNHGTVEIVCLIQTMYIEKWRNVLYAKVQEKRNINRAIEFWEINQTRKYFSHWKQFSQCYKIKSHHKKTLEELASNYLLKKCILLWHSKCQDIMEIRNREFHVITMIEHKIIRKYLLRWREYVAYKAGKRKDIEAAKELHQTFILREGLKEILRNSLRNIDRRYEVQLENATRRTIQNLEILKSSFDKWHSLIHLEKKFKYPYHDMTNNSQFINTETSFNDTPYETVKGACLVLPEYMRKDIETPVDPDLFIFPHGHTTNCL